MTSKLQPSQPNIMLSDLKVQSYLLLEQDRAVGFANITLERRAQRHGGDKWGIFMGGSVLHKEEPIDGMCGFYIESSASSRTEEELVVTRFTSAADALTFWNETAAMHFEQWLDHRCTTAQQWNKDCEK